MGNRVWAQSGRLITRVSGRGSRGDESLAEGAAAGRTGRCHEGECGSAQARTGLRLAGGTAGPDRVYRSDCRPSQRSSPTPAATAADYPTGARSNSPGMANASAAASRTTRKRSRRRTDVNGTRSHRRRGRFQSPSSMRRASTFRCRRHGARSFFRPLSFDGLGCLAFREIEDRPHGAQRVSS